MVDEKQVCDINRITAVMIIKYIDQSDNSSQCVLCFYTLRFSSLVMDLLNENMNRDITSYLRSYP
jgi:hypothetical protein